MRKVAVTVSLTIVIFGSGLAKANSTPSSVPPGACWDVNTCAPSKLCNWTCLFDRKFNLRFNIRFNRMWRARRARHFEALRLSMPFSEVASWYFDTSGRCASPAGCSYYGVANKMLPFGTQVRFEYGHRSVTATVDDRGPFVAGRDWDLNQNTATALGFSGVGYVQSSVSGA